MDEVFAICAIALLVVAAATIPLGMSAVGGSAVIVAALFGLVALNL